MLSERATPAWRWHGRSVKLVDGTGISMPDTEDNQSVFPQLATQAAGVGFPIARFVGVICLATGALIDAAMGPNSAGNDSTGTSLPGRKIPPLDRQAVLAAERELYADQITAGLTGGGNLADPDTSIYKEFEVNDLTGRLSEYWTPMSHG